MDDAFEMLGLPKTATCEQVRLAYRKKAAEAHPDKGGTVEGFVALHAAYCAAARECMKPIPCAKCGGAGYSSRPSGWQTARILCTECGGNGNVPRGGES